MFQTFTGLQIYAINLIDNCDPDPWSTHLEPMHVQSKDKTTPRLEQITSTLYSNKTDCRDTNPNGA